ncbi:hypothetical protein CDAR_211321 [Caerostris darwini]|uniref:Secreted protein n=1 Tax=Caerostris darwini TaxID=1538125 RepID=A0AAV4VZK3_9ARAC|nr:hypothetical protein CDAR_211321 [Caerostris darwini]
MIARLNHGIFLVVTIPKVLCVPGLQSHFGGPERCHSTDRLWYRCLHDTIIFCGSVVFVLTKRMISNLPLFLLRHLDTVFNSPDWTALSA